jgi:2-polyprenyl-6-methoxyphenol hydroxylase-like FAD-dependent oxidoreductase
MLLTDGLGRVLVQFDLAGAALRHGYPCINIWRQDLLADLIRSFDGVVHFDKTCVGVESRAESATARFSDGTDTVGDLIVGADGVGSDVRRSLWGGRARYAGTTCWEGRLVMAKPPVGKTVIAVATSSTFAAEFPMPDGEVHWFLDRHQRLDDRATEPDPRVLGTICQGWPEPFPSLVAASTPDDLYQTAIYVRRPPRRWSIGRTVLLGDSAHAMGPALGQGAATAFADAVVLGSAVAESRSIDVALRRYERERAWVAWRLWLGSTTTLRLRRTGILETLTRLTPGPLANRVNTASITPERAVRRRLALASGQ